MNFAKTTTAFAILFLYSLISNAQIEKLHRGDAVRQDTAVCMGIADYRHIRNLVTASDQVLSSNDALLNNYKEQSILLRQSITDRDIKISAMEAEAVRKDSLATEMHRDFVDLQVTTSKTLIDIEKRLPNPLVFKRLDFWVGVAIGAGGSFLLLR